VHIGQSAPLIVSASAIAQQHPPSQAEPWAQSQDNEPMRMYQQWLHDKAVQGDGNGVIVLPTGTGKTRVAFEIIVTALRRHPDRAAVFLCPNVNLVAQQADYFEHRFWPTVANQPPGLRLARVAGGSGKAELAHLLAATGAAATSSFVLFATGGTFLNFLESNTSTDVARAFGRLSVLILDECHHANRMEGASANGDTNHYYTRIVKEFYQDPAVRVDCRPKIIGLTASPGETTKDIADLNETLMSHILQVFFLSLD
jgi:ERCC4-related helicase